jgi:hypothetical protein
MTLARSVQRCVSTRLSFKHILSELRRPDAAQFPVAGKDERYSGPLVEIDNPLKQRLIYFTACGRNSICRAIAPGPFDNYHADPIRSE